ncbi:Rieske (2Fe-2S) protein [Pseudanabaena sp. FACHB-1998]|uniref:QcrA and Rieske domain-containing protein n=1 Tax=Pseudanabaena sp. FACHB-1998 TaxID=2692858 RepID=UPI001681B165|nr:Rieske (2Fe-2S) protein [Pseudanabaena sp. FACHB-1998]MBD2178224.1 Rieske (2Fe-2S) protein [Pseudanabaena sp. FACHB-1998]
MDRRKLLSWFGLGWLISFLPSSLSGCSDTNSVSNSSSPAAPESVAAAPRGEFKAIGSVAQLDKDGKLISTDKKILVVRDPKNSNKVLAVNSACTHKGCVVEWQKSSQEYVCPCHDAKFAANGSVKQGPANKALPTYAAKIEKGQVLVSS